MSYLKTTVRCERHFIFDKKTKKKIYLPITRAHARSIVYDEKSIVCQKCRRCLIK